MIFKNWPFFFFKRKLIRWADSGYYPPSSRLPETIRLSRTIWHTISEIKKNSAIDGAERGVTVLDIDGTMIITPAIIGESEKVLLKHQFRVQYQYDPSTQRCFREIYRDNHLIIKDYFITKTPPKKINLRVLFNIHTHPDGQRANFFSQTDLEGFLSSPKTPAMILVAADTWLVLKTNKITSFPSHLLPYPSLKEYAKLGLVFYKGGIRERLKRVKE